MKRLSIILLLLILGLLFFMGLQVSAKNRINPPVLAEPEWDSQATRDLAARTCFDCHSNETRWPLYSALPIIGGLIEKHVVEGRQKLNFSEWGTGRAQEDGEEAAEKVFDPMHYAEEDSLPQPPYSFFHPKARLNQTEREQLAAGLTASLGSEGFAGAEGLNESESREEDED